MTVATALRFYTVEQLSPSQYVTPEGYLVVYGVPIARTTERLGPMLYGPDETPIKPGADGVVKIYRHADEVFKPESIASFAGKPIVNDHPDGDVHPGNWNDLAVGVILNPRRGEGAEDDLLLADLQFTNARAIAEVKAGKREVSNGYDAEYVETGPGEGYQVNIIGNHVALVAKGRCGPTCRITDESYGGVNTMKKWLDQLKAAFASKDETKVAALMAAPPTPTTDDEGGPHIHVHTEGTTVHPGGTGDRKWGDKEIEEKFEEHGKKIDDCDKRMQDNHKSVMDALEGITKKMQPAEEEAKNNKEIEGELEEEAPAGTGDKARSAKDSTYLADSYQRTVAMAEIIAPGLHISTFDAARDPKKTFGDICGLRRKALAIGNADSATNGIIEGVRGKALTADTLDKMPCRDVRTLFHTVAIIKKEKNNARSVATTTAAATTDTKNKAPRTVAELNEYYRQHYK